MKHIGTHLHIQQSVNDRRTERGELMKFFCDKLNAGRATDGLPPLTMGRMGHILQGIPTKDLYYIQSVCNGAKNFSKKFWWELKQGANTKR